VSRNGLRKRAQALSVVSDIYLWAIATKANDEAILEQMDKRLYKNPLWSGSRNQRLTEAERAYVCGVKDGKRRELFNHYLVWAFDVGRPEGPVVGWGNLSETERESLKNASDPTGTGSGHFYWLDSNNRPTLSRFT
jgi:hypothetical protein